MIDWTSNNILKINNDIDCFNTDAIDEPKVDDLRNKIEPWLTAIFQSEHFSLLIGAGLPIGLTYLADVTAQGMGRIEFTTHKDKIKAWADKSAKEFGRGIPNIEDDFRSAIELLQGLKIQGTQDAITLEKEINEQLDKFIRNIIKTEREFYKSNKYQSALNTLKSFLISFSSRTATRERTNIFTTNYDRFIELALDNAGILTIDRFVGKIKPIFRTTKLELDYHYNPPGIRGEPRYVEGVIKYTKLHGSIDWKFDVNSIIKLPLEFGVDETTNQIPISPKDFSVIYPNSSKGIDTAYFPYSELFRDFSSGVCRPNSVVVTYGYGFGDTHINRVIEDMLTLPSTHLVIISFDTASGRIMKFYEKLNPAQVTLIIGSHLGSLQTLVENYLPKAAIDRIQERLVKTLEKRGVAEQFKKDEGTQTSKPEGDE
ncbi:SIR2 family protein [Marinoscillum sp. 108]|uniref:SIR2 family protein n=1 Tax=Marinoscillum sp. 108 TaxID=2653151 RepID=UPI0012F12CAD|nr:SIR2 family protein [Marinoscillum sp. 108]VXD19622.1 Fibronectin-binding protein (FBP) [Marinoscillum sp. 108]